jgi:hypothetical protein
VPRSLRETATQLLRLLARKHENATPGDDGELDGPTLAGATGISPNDVNDAVALLRNSGFVEWRQYLGTAPYDFGEAWITPAGRYEAERTSSALGDPIEMNTQPRHESPAAQISLPPTPIGSPYGFQDADWEFIADQKSRTNQLNVVLGYQFSSKHYDAQPFGKNIESMFLTAVTRYNSKPGAIPTTLFFRPLAAGYGEHLFNEIARDIIASDIAVFETSDLNPNVMLELGVALTWGVRVLPIKAEGQPRPPSDISGQTWADHRDSAATFTDPEHNEKLMRMVERAVRKKGRT